MGKASKSLRKELEDKLEEVHEVDRRKKKAEEGKVTRGKKRKKDETGDEDHPEGSLHPVETTSSETDKQKTTTTKRRRKRKKSNDNQTQNAESEKEETDPSKTSLSSAVVYIGHIPHGFYETEMLRFFSQFGDVENVRLSRSKRTGRSRGYGFVQFASEEVAPIVAEAMNGYYLFDRVLVCAVLPEEKVHPKLFHADPRLRRYFPRTTHTQRHRAKHNRKATVEQQLKRIKSLFAQEEKKRKRLKDMGIDYKFPGYRALLKKLL